MEDLTPLYNKEFYLAYLCGEDVVLPIPDGNAERYLAYLCGMDVTIPDVPDGRTETYIAYKCGEDVVLPDPMYRIEFYLAKWCGIDCEVPEPLYRIEYWLAQLANSGELKTVTGNPISVLDALARPAESLSIEILPQQDLHGYANPWPAGGGKNRFDKDTLSQASAYRTLANSYYYTDPIVLKPNTAYVMSPTSEESLGVTDYYVLFINPDASDPDYIVITNVQVRYPVTAGVPKVVTFTTGETGTIRLGVVAQGNDPKQSAIDAFMTINYQIEEGSTPTAWSPYENICPITGFTGVNIYRESAYDPDADPTYSISWQDSAGTVYGGSLDVTSGVLTVTHKTVDLGALSWIRRSNPYGDLSSTYLFSASPGVAKSSFAGICSSYKWVTNYIYFTDDYSAGSIFGTQIAIRDDRYTDKDAFTTAVAGQQCCYELATPITIQLTPTEVQMLLGNNTIWNDVGDMTLEYLADGPADDIDALQILLGNRYVNNGEPDEATDKEALEILLGGNTR